LNIDCGCFSTAGGKGSMNLITLFRDFSFILMSIFLFLFLFPPQWIESFFCKEHECR
jgi:hypothetical protein